MKDAAPQVLRSVAGVSATGHSPTSTVVPIVSPYKALPHEPYDTSHTRISLPENSPFATEMIARLTPAPHDGGRTMVTSGAVSG